MLKLLRLPLLITVSAACMAPSMAINGVHQFKHAPGPLAVPLAGASVLSVLLAGGTLEGMRQDRRWSRSKACADATRKDSRAFCAEYARKQAERAAAVKIEALDRAMTRLKGELLAAAGENTGQPDDPQAASVVTALSLVGLTAEPGKVGQGLNLWFAVAIEAIAALGPFALEAIFFGGAPLTPVPAAQANIAERPASAPPAETLPSSAAQPERPAPSQDEATMMEASPRTEPLALIAPQTLAAGRKLPPGVVEFRPRRPDTRPGGDVRDFLRDYLATGPKAGAEAEAKWRGFTTGALYRARDALQVDASGKIGRSQAWTLPKRPGGGKQAANRIVRPSKSRGDEGEKQSAKRPGSDIASH
jgi:hypothetical protein